MNRTSAAIRPVAGVALLMIAALALAPAHAHSTQSDPATIRVGLVRCWTGAKQIALASSSDCVVRRSTTGQTVLSRARAVTLSLQAGASGVALVDESGAASQLGDSVTVTPAEPAGTIAVSSPGRPTRRYRGAIEVSAASGALRLVNVVGLEEYLQGVVPIEMPESYPAEALKAQAIAARTYALRNRGKHARDGYDLCDTTNCQGYGGALEGKPRSAQAVIDTKGMVLTYKGDLACVLYSTDCGGATANYADLHPGDFPYLCSVQEPPDIVHCCWEKAYTLQELADRLTSAGVKEARGLVSVAITRTSGSGRALEVEFTGEAGKATLTGDRLRAILGLGVLKSTLFAVDVSGDGTVTFRGKGFGHGYGLCQLGAKALALAPHNYTCQQILAHYYPGAQVQAAPQTRAAGQQAAAPPQTRPTPPRRDGEIKLQIRVKAPELL